MVRHVGRTLHLACLALLPACSCSGGGLFDDTGDTADTGDTSDTADDTSDTSDTSGDTTDTSPVDTADTADTVAPEVQTLLPADHAADVALGATIAITFTEPVLGTSVGATSVVLTGPYGEVGRSLAVGPSTLTITPFVELTEFETTYSLTLTAVITDLAGNHLVPVTFDFTTVATDPAYRYALVPLDLANTTAPTLNALAISADVSDTCIAEARDDADPSQQWVLQPIPGGPWSTLENLSATAPATNSLEGGTAPSDALAADATTLSTGMRWELVADGACTQGGGARTCPSGAWDHDGAWRLQNDEHGSARSLTVNAQGGYIGMDPTADSDEQRFLILRNCLGGCR